MQWAGRKGLHPRHPLGMKEGLRAQSTCCKQRISKRAGSNGIARFRKCWSSRQFCWSGQKGSELLAAANVVFACSCPVEFLEQVRVSAYRHVSEVWSRCVSMYRLVSRIWELGCESVYRLFSRVLEPGCVGVYRLVSRTWAGACERVPANIENIGAGTCERVPANVENIGAVHVSVYRLVSRT